MTVSLSPTTLADRIAAAAAVEAGAPLPDHTEATIHELLEALERGAVRAAERGADGVWRAVSWVKQGILLAFRAGAVVDLSPNVESAAASTPFRFFDKHTLPYRELTPSDGVRVVPGGSSIRRGTFIARGVVCMPPMFVNVGAHIGAGTMIDSHALVGSCAQVGERVHLSAAAQIGGVLEPINAAPVIVEDDAIVGGNCGVYEGTVVRARAVLAAGVVLTRGTPVFDLVNSTVHRADGDRPLEIPGGAVVVPGARAIRQGWGAEQGLSLQTPVIVKYRDERTDLSTALESWLR
jgi:2,3,4,5-tetrahydropyridine-2,6-dicarboxylate N-succinyltransferase